MDGRKGNKIVTSITFMVCFAMVLMTARISEAFEPKLLWEKQFDQKIRDINMAEETGHVVITTTDEIVLYDKYGNTTFNWGPRIDRNCGSVDISSDGTIIAYTTALKEEFMVEKKVTDWDERVHYSTSDGKELWTKPANGFVRLSPDKSLLIVNDGSETSYFSVLTSNGKKLWDKEGLGAVFSQDSQYIAVTNDYHNPLTLLNALTGDVLFESSEPHDSVASISVDANYITTLPNYTGTPENSHDGVIYKRNGDVFFNGFGVVSKDGSRAAIFKEDIVSIMDLSSKTIIKEIAITTIRGMLVYIAGDLSGDGRYLALLGSRKETLSNVFVFDLENNKSWETDAGSFEPYPGALMYINLTSDGKYLLVIDRVHKIIKMYQIY